MKNSCYKKGIVLGIIVLFIGMSITPSTGNIMFFDDTTPPVTTHELDPPEPDGENGWYVSDVTVTLNATDDLSGVKEIYYRVSESEWNIHTGDFITFILDHDCLIDGFIEFYAVDYAGNQEEIKLVDDIEIDQLPPVIELTYEFVGGDPIHGWEYLFTATVYDFCSGLNTVEFYLNDVLQDVVVGPGPTYTWSFTYHSGLKITIGVGAWDNAGNYVYNETEIKIKYSRINIYQSYHLWFLRFFDRFPLLERLLNLI